MATENSNDFSWRKIYTESHLPQSDIYAKNSSLAATILPPNSFLRTINEHRHQTLLMVFINQTCFFSSPPSCNAVASHQLDYVLTKALQTERLDMVCYSIKSDFDTDLFRGFAAECLNAQTDIQMLCRVCGKQPRLKFKNRTKWFQPIEMTQLGFVGCFLPARCF